MGRAGGAGVGQMTGRQHAEIGVAAAAPAGVALGMGWLAGPELMPLWLAALARPVAGLLVALLVLGGGLLGSLLPDLDTDRSLLEAAPLGVLRRVWRRGWWPLWLLLAPVLLPVGALLALLNWLVMRLTDHRGATHGLTALALVTAGGWALTGWAIGPALALGLALGYAGHLAADALTPAGIELAAPWSRRRWYLLPRPFRFGGEAWQAGCLTHLALLVGLAAAGWLLWLGAGCRLLGAGCAPSP